MVWYIIFLMVVNSIILLLFLSCKITAGYIYQSAGYRTKIGEYYGAQAKVSAWGVPDTNPNFTYEVSIMLLNMNDDRYALIKAGFHVLPSLYGDNKLRFFTSWNSDAAHIPACFNLDCGGFVVANRSLFIPSDVVTPLSQYDGEDHYITIIIKKDFVTGFWTLYREHYGTILKLGWWEKGLVGNLDDKAIDVAWFPSVIYLNNDTGPTMGSGHFPQEGENKAAYMMDLKLYNIAGNAYDSPQISDLVSEIDKPECYNALPDKKDRHKFFYGGPAGCRH